MQERPRGGGRRCVGNVQGGVGRSRWQEGPCLCERQPGVSPGYTSVSSTRGLEVAFPACSLLETLLVASQFRAGPRHHGSPATFADRQEAGTGVPAGRHAGAAGRSSRRRSGEARADQGPRAQMLGQGSLEARDCGQQHTLCRWRPLSMLWPRRTAPLTPLLGQLAFAGDSAGQNKA